MNITLSLSKEEWAELAAAIYSKAIHVEKGDYGDYNEEEGFDPDEWAHDLWNLHKKIEEAMEEVNI